MVFELIHEQDVNPYAVGYLFVNYISIKELLI